MYSALNTPTLIYSNVKRISLHTEAFEMAGSVGRVLCCLKKESRLIPSVQRTCHYCSTSQDGVTGVWTQKIDQNLELRALKQDGVVRHARPLMLLFGWMLAKRKHMQKYEEYYLKRGYNVLTVTGYPMDILKPARAQGIASKILSHIDERSREVGKQPILLHGFSVGGYLIGEFHVKLNTEDTIARDLLIAQVFDSPVDFDGIPEGFSKVLTKNPALRFLIRNSLHLYMAVFRTNVSKYLKASEAFKVNKYNVPSLFLYSKADPVGNPVTIESVITDFYQRQIPVRSKCWHDSPHVSHFHYYPKEYVEILTSFLDTHAPSPADFKGHDSQDEGEGRRKMMI
ncbi:transmembrane protein 53-B-like [Mizuhopecten yessoensis]|uniref:Transmembrane protein 53-B n=1 Tax=Mizuhopecten yessoensis TaxID=6573 RepID=A0A210QP63_MIZYE|nr:transmembrane protein 53-B-like [Mizuhopecten yessoensis]OWF50534.1 Transmembrane protein 53-B [Mizuhopecten yessoensis]